MHFHAVIARSSVAHGGMHGHGARGEVGDRVVRVHPPGVAVVAPREHLVPGPAARPAHVVDHVDVLLVEAVERGPALGREGGPGAVVAPRRRGAGWGRRPRRYALRRPSPAGGLLNEEALAGI